MFSVTALTLTRRRFLNRLKPDAPEKPFYQCTVLTQACRFYDIVTPILWPSKRAPARGYLPVTVSQIIPVNVRTSPCMRVQKSLPTRFESCRDGEDRHDALLSRAAHYPSYDISERLFVNPWVCTLGDT
jgi:hypothetical protein